MRKKTLWFTLALTDMKMEKYFTKPYNVKEENAF